MAHAYFHAKSSARTFGGTYHDYMELHVFMDHTKAYVPDNRHRLFLHNAWGIFFVEQIFGPLIHRQSDGKDYPTRTILEQHVKEDFGGKIPTLEQCFDPTMLGHFRTFQDNIFDHCEQSVAIFGGLPSDYISIHQAMNQIRNVFPHQAGMGILHNAWGITLLVRVLGETFPRSSDGIVCSTRPVLEAHVKMDCGCIPTMAESIQRITVASWMYKDALPLSRQFEYEQQLLVSVKGE